MGQSNNGIFSLFITIVLFYGAKLHFYSDIAKEKYMVHHQSNSRSVYYKEQIRLIFVYLKEQFDAVAIW